MDAITLSLIIGLATLIVERVFSVIRKIRKSSCCGSEFDLTGSEEKLLS